MCARNVLYIVYLLLCSQSPLKTVIHDATHIINELFEHVEPSYENALGVQKTVIQSKLGTKEHKIYLATQNAIKRSKTEIFAAFVGRILPLYCTSF